MRGSGLALAAVLMLAACSASAAGPAKLPACTMGHGKDGSVATLAIRQGGTAFTGTYRIHAPGMPPATSLAYDVTGTAEDGRIDSEWTAAGVSIHVTGTYTATQIRLDNPGGTFAVDQFRAATGCPETGS
jgi:hypothetical protein